jgi:hypothetical protein
VHFTNFASIILTSTTLPPPKKEEIEEEEINISLNIAKLVVLTFQCLFI